MLLMLPPADSMSYRREPTLDVSLEKINTPPNSEMLAYI